MDFAAWAAADRIVATTNHNRPLQTVTAADRIRAALKVLGQYSSGWGVPEAGVPVADIRLNFYQGERLLGHIGLARAYLVLHQRGGFWSQNTGPDAYDALNAVLDLEPRWIGSRARKQ
jgi:hypothetical protein